MKNLRDAVVLERAVIWKRLEDFTTALNNFNRNCTLSHQDDKSKNDFQKHYSTTAY